jgi:histidinol phosphatase-like enzyme (inositol monophosphatase family)
VTDPNIADPEEAGVLFCETMVLEAHREFALELARASGEFIKPYFAGRDLGVERKADGTIVTAADRGAEKLMREMIQAKFPEHGVVGEEFASERANAEYVWVLDPIDGTISFASGVPLFGTLIALKHQGRPVLGIIHQPVLGELVLGDGETTTHNGQMVHCSSTARIDEAKLLATGFKSVEVHQNGPAFFNLVRRCKTVRGWGDCYGYLMVATGRADIMCDPIMNEWDIAALIPVIRGAGGVLTDWQGRDPVGAKSLVAAATPQLHAATIAALNPGS